MSNLLSEKILVTGLARNVGDRLYDEIENLNNHLKNIFSSVMFLVIESDSKDNTLEVCKKLERKYKSQFKYLSLGNLELEFSNRIERLTLCRNMYVNEIRTNQNYKEVNLIVVCDFDIKNNRLNLNDLKLWSIKNNWAGIFANQTGAYFDIYALRIKNWNDSDCFEQYHELRQNISPKVAKEITIWSKMIRIPKDSSAIQVQSAFGGLGVYKKQIFLKYDYSPINRKFNCSEHVTFNLKITQADGELFIVPSLTNFSWNPHNLSKFAIIRKIDKSLQSNLFNNIRKFFRKRLP